VRSLTAVGSWTPPGAWSCRYPTYREIGRHVNGKRIHWHLCQRRATAYSASTFVFLLAHNSKLARQASETGNLMPLMATAWTKKPLLATHSRIAVSTPAGDEIPEDLAEKAAIMREFRSLARGGQSVSGPDICTPKTSFKPPTNHYKTGPGAG